MVNTWHNPPNLDIISPVTPVLVDAWHNEEETRALGPSAAEPDKVCFRLFLLKQDNLEMLMFDMENRQILVETALGTNYDLWAIVGVNGYSDNFWGMIGPK